MTTHVKQILKRAINLPAIDRAELIEKILSSFDFPERKKIDAQWAKEAEMRVSAFSSGRIKAKSSKQVFQTIQLKKQMEKIVFLEPAIEEFEATVDYYNLQSEGLGFEFALEIKRTLERISQYP